MPKQSRSSSRSKTPKRNFGSRNFSDRKFASKVRTVVREQVAEKKRSYHEWNNAEFDWNGHRQYLDTIPQGSGEGERIGRVVTPYSFSGRFELLNASGDTNRRATWTAFLVQDLQTVGDAHATVAEILSNVGSSLAPMGHINIANKGRFKIIRRWEGVLGINTMENSIQYLNIFHKFRKGEIKNIRYNGTASTDIEANSLMFVLLSSEDPVNNICFASGVGRLWYTDV